MSLSYSNLNPEDRDDDGLYYNIPEQWEEALEAIKQFIQ